MSNQTIQLQSIGLQNAKPAGEFRAGDTTLWNFGYTATVLGIHKQTEKTVWLRLESEGEEYIRGFSKTRLVGVAA